MSKNFYLVLALVFGTYAASISWVLTIHLEHEQAWSQELLDQNTHSIKVMGVQKEFIRIVVKELNACYKELGYAPTP